MIIIYAVVCSMIPIICHLFNNVWLKQPKFLRYLRSVLWLLKFLPYSGIIYPHCVLNKEKEIQVTTE